MLYRIATYAMPDAARDEFLAQSRIAQDLVRTQPGYMGDQWLEKVSGPGSVNIITIAKWRDAESVVAAGKALGAHQAQSGFDPDAFAAQYGIVKSVAVFEERA